MTQTDLSRLINEFTVRVAAVVEDAISARIKAAVEGALVPGGRRPGRPARSLLLESLPTVTLRKAAPKQLCPVPGCTNAAAPVFGMVCAKHKDVPKAKIAQFRAARRAKKVKAAKAAKTARGRTTREARPAKMANA
jgi:hypothetical protein